MDAVVPETLFEGVVEGASLPLGYRLVVDYPDGGSETIADPYSFLPTLGDVDLHLIGEGRHEQLGCVLGAHVREVGGVGGHRVRRLGAVRTRRRRSSATSTSGTRSRTRCAPSGSRGCGSSSSRDVETGTHYKFAVRGADGVVRLKADPVAARSEEPPRTASIVFEPAHEWSDGEWMDRRHASRPWQEPMSIYEVHLGSWRRGLSYRELAVALADHVTRSRLHPRRADARHGAPVRRFVGIPGHRVLHTHRALRHARRLPRVRRHVARTRDRRHPRLGPRALPTGRRSRSPASTGRRSTSTPIRAGVSTPTGARSSSTSGATRYGTSSSRAR